MNKKQRARFFMEHQEKFWNENKDKEESELYIGWKEASLAIERVRELHQPDKNGMCIGCKGRCSCSEGDIYGDNTWVSCPTIKALDGEK